MASIFKRLVRILNAKASKTLDGMEGIDTLTQLIAERVRSYDLARAKAADVIAKRYDAEKEVASIQEEINSWESKIDISLQKEDNILAREALSAKKKAEKLLAESIIRLTSLQTTEKAFRDSLDECKAVISKLESDKVLLEAKLATAQTKEELRKMTSDLGKSGIGSEYGRISEKVEHEINKLDAQTELDNALGNTEILNKFKNLDIEAENKALDEELAARKNRLSK